MIETYFSPVSVRLKDLKHFKLSKFIQKYSNKTPVCLLAPKTLNVLFQHFQSEELLLESQFVNRLIFKTREWVDRTSRTDLLCPNIYFGCYLEGSPLQGLKLWGPGTFYVPPGGMPAGPAPHPGQPTAVAQNGTVYYHHTPVRPIVKKIPFCQSF